MGKKIKKPKKLRVLGNRRKCGDCTACCSALRVTAVGVDPDTGVEWNMDKPKWVPCEHETGEAGKGCGVYKDRPYACRHFECGWLKGFGPEADRPDRSGAILYTEDTALGTTFMFHEVHVGAHRTERGQTIIDRAMKLGVPIIVLGFREDGSEFRKAIGDEEMVQKIQAKFARDGVRPEHGVSAEVHRSS